MAQVTVEQSGLQEEMPVVLTTFIELETLIKGHHVYKDIWTPKLGEELEVRIEPDNHVDKFSVCIKKDGKIAGHLKKGASGRFAKTIYYFLCSDYYSSCVAKVSGKRYNLKDGEGLQVPCSLRLIGKKRYLGIVKQELQKISEI